MFSSYDPNLDPVLPPRTAFTPTGGEAISAPALQGDSQADIVIVGGGIAGVSAALHAAEGRASVVLVEANSIGWGASGRNAGHVAPASKLGLAEAIDRYGPVHGVRFNEASENGPDRVFELVERFGFDADVRRGGIIVAAHSRAAVDELSTRADIMASEGKPARFLDRKAAAEAIGSELYLGALHDARGGTINSLAYVRGLARAAMALGVRIHQDSRALEISRRDGLWTVRTQQGRVSAARVIICTNAYTDGLWTGLRSSIVPARSHHLLSYPLPDEISRTILPGAAAMTDRRRLLIGLRVTRDGRLQFNGYGSPTGPDTGIDVSRTIARIEELFPHIGPVRLDPEFRWSGWMAMSLAGTWKMHELAPGVTAVLGCNGRGVAMGTFLGRDLALHALGTPAGELTLPFEPVKSMPFRFLHAGTARLVVRYKDWKDKREMALLRKSNGRPGR